MENVQPKRWQVLLWPPVADERYGKRLIRVGYYVAFFIAGYWGLLGLFGAFCSIIEQHDCGFAYGPLQVFAYIVIGVGIGWGILRRSRIAASAALILCLVGFIGYWVTKGFWYKDSIQSLILAWIFAQSARAVFAYTKALGKDQKV